MCERCDADFSTLSDDDLRKEARTIAAVMADFFLQVAPSPAGAVYISTVGRALQAVVPKILASSSSERITPKMEEIARRTAEMAVALFVDSYTETEGSCL